LHVCCVWSCIVARVLCVVVYRCTCVVCAYFICLLIDMVFARRERPSLWGILFLMELPPPPFPVSLTTCLMASKCACLSRWISLKATAPLVIPDLCTTCVLACSTSSAPYYVVLCVGACGSFISCCHFWRRSKVMLV
jgi:hypothetical protein